MKKKIFVYLVSIFFLFLRPELSFAEINKVIISVGTYPITRLDLFKEIKLIAIISNQEITEENKERIKNLAVQSLITKAIKTLEIERYKVEKFNKTDLENWDKFEKNHPEIFGGMYQFWLKNDFS